MKKLAALLFTACLSSTAFASTTNAINEQAFAVDITAITQNAVDYLTVNQIKVDTSVFAPVLNAEAIAFKHAERVLTNEEVTLANNALVAE